jgi:indole-3-glycerol phosphate synthase
MIAHGSKDMTILNQIVRDLLPSLTASKERLPLRELEIMAKDSPPPKDFVGVFRMPGLHVIAELKKASPSKGVIRPNFDYLECAQALESAGAAALSVLTEENYFLGSLRVLKEVAQQVDIPLLRKDFIVDPYQICEARLHGASAVLLIAALLPAGELARLSDYAKSLGLTVLGEAHNEEELKTLLGCDIELIGINARDLHSFGTNTSEANKLLGQVPADRIAIAESAMNNHEDLVRAKQAGARGFLVGEALMRAECPGDKLKEMLCGHV